MMIGMRVIGVRIVERVRIMVKENRIRRKMRGVMITMSIMMMGMSVVKRG